MSETQQIDLTRLPQHVAIIMDGNGRWAKEKGLQRTEGHIRGVDTVRRITEEAAELGIRYLTLYTFSTENWKRPKEEVDALMNLIVVALERETPDLIKNNVRLITIGDLQGMPLFACQRLTRCMQQTAHCTGLTLNLALNYSAKWDLLNAANRIAADAKAGKIEGRITDKILSSYLSTTSIPNPDMLIRTGGEMRISNFLLWEIAYSELFFTTTYWPDYSKDEFRQAIISYQKRERRFGRTSAQVAHTTPAKQP